jgi:phage terminase large subunit-like protein
MTYEVDNREVVKTVRQGDRVTAKVYECDFKVLHEFMIDANRVATSPDLSRIVGGVSPPGGATECGIVVSGIALCPCRGKPEVHAFVVEDASIKASPGFSTSRFSDIAVIFPDIPGGIWLP